jgi:hypothetical protein
VSATCYMVMYARVGTTGKEQQVHLQQALFDPCSVSCRIVISCLTVVRHCEAALPHTTWCDSACLSLHADEQ